MARGKWSLPPSDDQVIFCIAILGMIREKIKIETIAAKRRVDLHFIYRLRKMASSLKLPSENRRKMFTCNKSANK